MRDELIQFVQSPDRRNYLAFREKVIASTEYQPYSDEFEVASELFEQHKIEEAKEMLLNAMSNLVLSPRAHQLIGFLYHKLGDDESAQMEMMISHACIEGILASGDGSENDPYIVTRTSDEYDILEHLDKELKQQSLAHKGERHLDLVECTDGSAYWFDITDAFNQLSKSLGT
jgi:UDP-N-acetylglucosamine transferase subunit ALG13